MREQTETILCKTCAGHGTIRVTYRLEVGDPVQVRQHGRWYDGRVVSRGPGRYPRDGKADAVYAVEYELKSGKSAQAKGLQDSRFYAEIVPLYGCGCPRDAKGLVVHADDCAMAATSVRRSG